MTDNLFTELGLSLEDPDVEAALRLAIDVSRIPSLIREARLVRGITVEQIAERMGVSVKNVQLLERPGADLHLSTIRRYAMSVGVMVSHNVSTLPEPLAEGDG